MATKCIINKSTMTGIAEAIRTKGGTTDTLLPSQMAGAIEALPSGGDDPHAEPEWFRDGFSHVWVDIPSNDRSMHISLSCSGSITVDWGDGTDSTTSAIYAYLIHDYDESGEYVITIKGSGTFYPGAGSAETLFGMGRTTYTNVRCSKYAWAVELGENCYDGATGNNWQFMMSIGLRHFKWISSRQPHFRSSISGCRLDTFDIGEMTACETITSTASFNASKKFVLPTNLINLQRSFDGALFGIENFEMPPGVASYPNNVIRGNSFLISHYVPDSVKTIGATVFYQCFSLESLTIGSGIEKIGSQIVYMCNNLRAIRINAETPPAIETTSFDNWTYSGRKIIVPNGCGEAYRTTGNWTKYADIIEEEAS